MRRHDRLHGERFHPVARTRAQAHVDPALVRALPGARLPPIHHGRIGSTSPKHPLSIGPEFPAPDLVALEKMTRAELCGCLLLCGAGRKVPVQANKHADPDCDNDLSRKIAAANLIKLVVSELANV
jgi:hypothetical protein